MGVKYEPQHWASLKGNRENEVSSLTLGIVLICLCLLIFQWFWIKSILLLDLCSYVVRNIKKTKLTHHGCKGCITQSKKGLNPRPDSCCWRTSLAKRPKNWYGYATQEGNPFGSSTPQAPQDSALQGVSSWSAWGEDGWAAGRGLPGGSGGQGMRGRSLLHEGRQERAELGRRGHCLTAA